MDFFQLIAQRHSIREFQLRDVEADLVVRLLEAANRAPSAGDLQAYHIYVVRPPEQRQKLARIAEDQGFIAQAPVALVFVALPAVSGRRYGKRGQELYSVQDATIACTFAMLSAADLGLGSCWVGAFDENALCRLLEADRSARPVAILAVGYPAGAVESTPRRPLSELVTYR